jgi:phosphoglycolate phosphatase
MHLLFDFDGTLVDSLEAAFSAYRRVAPGLGFRALCRDEIQDLRGMHAVEVIRTLGVPLYRVPLLASRVRRAMRSDLLGTAPVDGMASVLDLLVRRGHRIGVLSSNSVTSVRAYIQRHRLPSFDPILGGTGLFGKAAVLRRQARRWQIDPRELIYVGDELRDLDAARDAGARFAAVGWGYTAWTRLADAAPDFFCRHPRDLLDVVGRPGPALPGRDADRAGLK